MSAVGSEGARVLVVGASGLVGARVLRRLGARATGTYLSHPTDRSEPLDITDGAAARALLERVRPAAVVLAAAYTNVDGCERDPERSRAVNVEGTLNVARAAAAVAARLVFFSTDYVFGSANGPHALDAPYDPQNVYGEHKRLAEEIVRAEVDNHLIVRGCNMYGYQAGGKNFVMGVLSCAREGRTMRVPVDQWGSPTDADDLADATALAVDSDIRGVAHFAGPDYVSRPQWARKAAAALGFNDAFVEAVPTSELAQAARRPLEAGLDASATERVLGCRFATLDEGLARFRRDLGADTDHR